MSVADDTRKTGGAASDPRGGRRGTSPRRRPRATLAFTVGNTIAFGAATIVATTALWPIYRSTSVIILVAVALVAGSAIAIFGAQFRWPSWLTVLSTVGTFLVLGVPLAVPTQAQFLIFPTLDGLRALVAGVALSWKQLLTVTLPVGDYEALLVPAFIVVLLATIIGLSIALRSTRAELAAIAPIAVFLIATAFGPNYPSRPYLAPLALLAIVLGWLICLRWYSRRAAIRLLSAQTAAAQTAAANTESGQSGLSSSAASERASPPRATARAEPALAGARVALSAALIIAIAAAAAIGVAALVPPSANRAVLRTVIAQPFDVRNYVSPLAAFRQYLQPATATSVLFSISGLPSGDRVRLATLDTYDGIVFSAGSDRVSSESGSFTRVPSRFDQSGVSGKAVTLVMGVRNYTGVWVPTSGKLESIDFTGARSSALRGDFYYNNVSGTAVVTSGLQAGDSYTLTAVIPTAPPANEVSALKPGSASVPTAQNVPDAVAAKLQQYSGAIQGSGPRLDAMLAGLAADGYISHGLDPAQPASRSGHAADRITQLLSEPRMIGDAEQYAVAATLMAQQLGFPARVVFGFDPVGELITGGDVSAWMEVNTAQYGWVTIDPTPPVRPIPTEVPKDTTQIARPQTVVTPPQADSVPPNRQTAPQRQQQLVPDLSPLLQIALAVLRVVAWALAAAAIVLAPFILIIAAKLRRRRIRRRAPALIDRISGGWQEFEDAVLDHGFTLAPSSTRTEVAQVAGGGKALVLAAVADRAVFSPAQPGEADAESVWRAVDELGDALGAGLTRWQRLRSRVSLRSLGGYSVRTLLTTQRKGDQ
jgi:hypothetical protein